MIVKCVYAFYWRTAVEKVSRRTYKQLLIWRGWRASIRSGPRPCIGILRWGSCSSCRRRAWGSTESRLSARGVCCRCFWLVDHCATTWFGDRASGTGRRSAGWPTVLCSPSHPAGPSAGSREVLRGHRRLLQTLKQRKNSKSLTKSLKNAGPRGPLPRF